MLSYLIAFENLNVNKIRQNVKKNTNYKTKFSIFIPKSCPIDYESYQKWNLQQFENI